MSWATSLFYTLSLHDALPICLQGRKMLPQLETVQNGIEKSTWRTRRDRQFELKTKEFDGFRSEEHSSELQSRRDLVCRLLLEKKNNLLFVARTVFERAHAVE